MQGQFGKRKILINGLLRKKLLSYQHTHLGGYMDAGVSVWMVIRVFVYVIYGRNRSALQHAVYDPATHVDEIYKSSAKSSREICSFDVNIYILIGVCRVSGMNCIISF